MTSTRDLLKGKAAQLHVDRHGSLSVKSDTKINFLPDRKLVEYIRIRRRTVPENVPRVAWTLDKQKTLTQRVHYATKSRQL